MKGGTSRRRRWATYPGNVVLKVGVDYSTVDDSSVDDSSVDNAAIDDPAVNNVVEGGRLADESLLWLGPDEGAGCGGRGPGGTDNISGSAERSSSWAEALAEALWDWLGDSLAVLLCQGVGVVVGDIWARLLANLSLEPGVSLHEVPHHSEVRKMAYKSLLYHCNLASPFSPYTK